MHILLLFFSNSVPASAVCAFSMGDVNATFKSRFKGQKTALHNWLAVHEKDTPKPHPEGVGCSH